MIKVMKTYLLAFLVALAATELVYAVAKTTFTDVHVTKTLTVDGAVTAGSVNCSNVSTTTLTAANLIATYGVATATAAVTGAGTFGSVVTSTVSYNGTSTVTGTPASSGLLVVNSTYQLYVSTCATSSACWVKVGAQ
jgi:hypothetical protein